MKNLSILSIIFCWALHNNAQTCDFNYSPSTACEAGEVTFSVISPQNGSTYSWDIDNDGSIDTTGTTISETFSDAGIFLISLYENGSLCHSENIEIFSLPDPTVGVAPGTGVIDSMDIRTCTSTPVTELELTNLSESILNNASYTIDWGDGNIDNYTNATFNNAGVNAFHTYTNYGYYSINIEVVSYDGCAATSSYSYYNGNNPSIGLATPGNTVSLCSPAPVSFPITDYQNNPPGTEYIIYVNGEQEASYNQSNIPSSFTHLFEESSCGETTSTQNYDNAFDVQIIASNPCGSSSATVEPIEISLPPDPGMEVDYPGSICEGNIWTFNDTTQASEIISGNPSSCLDILATWSVSPGAPFVDWILINGNLSGSDSIVVQFLTAGVYTIEMDINSQACGLFTVTETITVIENPILDFDINLSGTNNCASFIASFENTSSGGTANYTWNVAPPTGWTTTNGTTVNSQNVDIQFDSIGLYEVTLMGTNDCGTFILTDTVEVSGPPELTMDSIPDFCESAAITFNADSYEVDDNYAEITGYNWSFPGGSPTSSDQAEPGQINYSNPGTYTVTLEVENACGTDIQSIDFTIEEAPELVLNGPDSLCLTDNPVQLEENIDGGIWSGNGTTSSGEFNPSIAGTGTHDIIYETTVSLCTVSDTITIEVLPLPTLNISASETEACINDPAIDLIASPAGGTWTSSNSGSVVGNQFIPANSGEGVYELTYSYFDAFGCSNSESITIEIFGLPDVIGSDAAFCISSNIETLPAAFPSGGVWSGPGVTDPNNGLFSSILAGGVGIYQLTYSYEDGNSCTNSTEITVTVNALPTIDMDPDIAVCEDGNLIDLSTVVSPSGGVWTDSGSLLTGTVFNPAFAGPGIYTFTYSYGLGSCSVQENFSITVNELPELTVSADAMVCEQVNCLPLNASPAGGYWTSNNGGVVSGDCFNPVSSGIGNYTLTYNYTDSNGCSNTTDLTVEVYAIPELIISDTSYCSIEGDYALPIPNFVGGTWTGPGVTDPNGYFNPVLAGGPGTYTLNYAYSDALGCSNDIDINVVITPVPVVELGADLTICVNESPIDLSNIASPSGGMFFGTSISGSVFDPSNAGVGSHEIIYIYGQGSCFSTDTMEITINPLPIIDLSANIEGICVSESSIALEASPAGGSWSGSSGAVLDGNNFEPNTSGIGTYTLSYTYTDFNGCSNTEDWIIEVYDLPVVTSSDISYCNLPGSVNLPFASPIGGTWAGPGVVDSLGIFDPSLVSGIGSYTLTYTYSDNFGCSNYTEINVSIVAPPAIDAGPDLGICLSASAYDLSSQETPMGGNWSGPGVTGSLFDPSNVGTGTYTLVYTYGTNNCQVWDSISVDVYDLPLVSVSGNDTEACVALDSMELIASPTGGVWTVNNGGILNSNIFYPSSSGSGSYELTYTFTDANGCSNSDQFEMIIYDLPIIDVSDISYCNQGSAVLLPAANPPGGSWSGPGILNASTGLFDPVMNAGVYTLTYTFTDNNGCSNSADATITIIEPVAISAGPDKSFCVSESDINLELEASPMGGSWSGPGVSGSMFSPKDAGVGIHEIVYTIGSNNCQVWDTLFIEIFELPTINISNNETDACVSIDSVYLNASPIGGSWSSNDGGVLNGDIFLPASSGPGIYTLVYSYTNSNNCVSEEQLLFTVNDLPFLVSNDTSYCQSPGLVNLPFASPAGGVWTGPGVVSQSGVFDPMAVPSSGNYALYYSYVDANSCVSSIQIEVEVQDLELVEAGPDTILCIDQGLYQMQAFSPATGGTWSGTGIIDPVNGIFDPSISGPGVFAIQLDYGNLNCSQSDIVQIEVIDWVSQVDPGPDFEVCAYDEEIILNGYTPSGGKWYGPGITNNDEGRFNPVLAGLGSHTLEYIFLDSYSKCEVTTERIITVRPVPNSDFVADEVSCVNTEVDFLNASDDTFDSDWTIVNHANSSNTDFSYTFDEIGTYEVLLLSTNTYTCQDSILKTVLVTEAPTPSFAMDLDSGCGPLTVNFENNSFGYDMNVQWDFGNAVFSTDENPDPITFDMGSDITTYPIRLEVSNLCGAQEYVDTVLVYPSPQVNFGPITNIDCSPMEVTFANATLGMPDYFFWDLGNGNTSTDSLPQDQLYFAGEEITEYTVTLIASNSCGSDTMQQFITVNPPSVDAFVNIPELLGCAPFTPEFNNISTFGAEYFWDFGDGNTSTETNPVHTYLEDGEYEVILRVNNNCNFDSISNIITVRPQPVIDFEMDDNICVNNTVNFLNNSQNAQGFQWDFGDGNISNLVSPSHTYGNSGSFTISLIGEDSETGCSGLLELPITVRDLPVASFATSDTVSCAPLIVQFENNSDSGLYYTWDFGNGASSTEYEPSYTFTVPGDQTVSLTVEDLYGCTSDKVEFDLFVNPEPTADFTIPALDYCTEVNVELENSSTDNVSNQWFLDGVLISQLIDPVLTFTESGSKNIRLLVSNNYNCTDQLERDIEIFQRPEANVNFVATEGCVPFDLEFVDISSNTTEVTWMIDEEEVGQNSSTNYSLNDPGLYSVGMIAINTFADCADTIVLQDYIEVLPSPTAAFEYIDLGDGFVAFTNLSEEYESLIWNFGDNSSSTDTNPEHEYAGNGNWEASLTVTNSFNCVDTYSEAVGYDLLVGFYVPNAFSPEFGEGDVRVFKPAGLGVKDYVIEVFAPWGQQLWQSSELDGEQPAAAWDGVYKGKVMPQGAYAWKASVEFVNGKRQVLNGTVTLIR